MYDVIQLIHLLESQVIRLSYNGRSQSTVHLIQSLWILISESGGQFLTEYLKPRWFFSFYKQWVKDKICGVIFELIVKTV